MNEKLNEITPYNYLLFLSSSYTLLPNEFVANPGLAEEGTRCGTDMMCKNQECVNVSTPNFSSCPVGINGLACSGNESGVSILFFKKLNVRKKLLPFVLIKLMF